MANSLDVAIASYLKRGFGTMNKNDFEVWIFNYLINNSLRGKMNYEISHELKIPESKVKRLYYEATLKYGVGDESVYLEKLNNLLKNVVFVQKDNCVQFVIEDIAIRKYLNFLLKKNGKFSDSSFNSEIVSMDLDDLQFVFSNTESKDAFNTTIKKAQLKLNDDGLSLKGIVKLFVEKFVGTIATKSGEFLLDLSLSGIVELVSKLCNS